MFCLEWNYNFIISRIITKNIMFFNDTACYNCVILQNMNFLALHGFKGFISQLRFDFIGKGLIYNVPISKHSFGEYKSLTIFKKVLSWFDVRLKLLLHFKLHFFFMKTLFLLEIMKTWGEVLRWCLLEITCNFRVINLLVRYRIRILWNLEYIFM